MEGECTRNGVDLLALPFHRMLNVVFSYMIENVRDSDDQGKQTSKYRDDFLNALVVHKWPVPHSFFGSKVYSERAKSKAPSWWEGDVEASQSFMAAMNVRP